MDNKINMKLLSNGMKW